MNHYFSLCWMLIAEIRALTSNFRASSFATLTLAFSPCANLPLSFKSQDLGMKIRHKRWWEPGLNLGTDDLGACFWSRAWRGACWALQLSFKIESVLSYWRKQIHFSFISLYDLNAYRCTDLCLQVCHLALLG